MKIEWTKRASVTTGGKPHFWTALHCGKRLHIVWDRKMRWWAMEIDHVFVGYSLKPEVCKRALAYHLS